MSADGDADASPRRPGLKAFLPLSEDLALSNHARNLQGLMRTRTLSTTPNRRSSAFRGHESYASDEEAGRPDMERRRSWEDGYEERRMPGEERRLSNAAAVLMTPQMRSQRLIGNSNPRYRWETYFKTEDELKKYKKPM